MNKHAFGFRPLLTATGLSIIGFVALRSSLPALHGMTAQRHSTATTSSDMDQKDEFGFARLRYPTQMASYGRFGGFGMFRNGGWSEDYPHADRPFVQGVLRLTRIDARPYQEVLDPDSEEVFNWPWLYAVNVADWDFNEQQAKRMRDYLQRGGFLIADSFHGAAAWESLMIGMRKILPDRPIQDLTNKDEIFHVLYDLDERPGFAAINTFIPAGLMRMTAFIRSGKPFATIMATLGNMPMTPSIRSASRRMLIAWASITSFIQCALSYRGSVEKLRN